MSLLAVRGGASRRGAGPLWCGAPPLSSYWGTNMTHDPAQRPVRVLVVDDHADVRFLVRAILEDAAPAVVFAGEASGAEEALAALDALEPDVVVLDARMPRVDGFEAAEMLLARRPDLPILLCSAIVDDDSSAIGTALHPLQKVGERLFGASCGYLARWTGDVA